MGSQHVLGAGRPGEGIAGFIWLPGSPSFYEREIPLQSSLSWEKIYPAR